MPPENRSPGDEPPDREHDSRPESDAESRARTAACSGARGSSEPLSQVELAQDLADFASVLVARLADRSESFSRYDVHGEIARGGQGAIYRVWDPDLRRHLAMKVVLEREQPPAADREARTLGRFLEEAQITGQLDHPGTVPVHELGLDASGRVFFTMPLVRGRTFDEIIGLVHSKDEDWTLTRALGVVLKVCEAVAYAHSKNVIHRDLKPANVMVGRFGEVYVMDWGLARVLGGSAGRDIRIRDQVPHSTEVRTDRRDAAAGADSPLVTMDGDVLGTPAYMPPEQAQGRIDELDARSDVYSIGAILYHLLAGHMPYVPRQARLGPWQVLNLLLAGPPPPISEIAPQASRELAAICHKAMSPDLGERYSSALDLARDVEAFLDRRPVAAHEPGLGHIVRLAIERNRRTTATALVGLVAIVAILAIAFTRLSAAHAETQRWGDRLAWTALREREKDLYPAIPERLPAFDDWLGDADRVLSREASYARELAGDPDEALGVLLEDIAALRDLREVVSERRAFAAGLELASVTSRRAEWDEAIADIARLDAYGGLVLAPQVGLAPLRRNPQSGLWEFVHLATGTVPQWEAGSAGYSLEPATGIILALLPGGAFTMGSPPHEPDRSGDFDETRHRVSLDPFFIGKYETTQAQWARLIGEVPAEFRPGTRPGYEFSELHPIETVSWHGCVEFARRAHLRLPTEAQWEYACRAGNLSSFGWGEEWSALEGLGNTLARNSESVVRGAPTAPWEDAHVYSAPVGSYSPNGFGLFDMYGNVSEWCDGTLSTYPGDSDAFGDGIVFDPAERHRVWRGGSWYTHPVHSRVARRSRDWAFGLNATRGVRFARELSTSK